MPDSTTPLPAITAALTAALFVWVVLRFATRAIDRFAARLERDGVLDEGALFAKRLTRFVRSTLWFVAVLVAGLVLLRGIGVRGAPRISTTSLAVLLPGTSFARAASFSGSLSLKRPTPNTQPGSASRSREGRSFGIGQRA